MGCLEAKSSLRSLEALTFEDQDLGVRVRWGCLEATLVTVEAPLPPASQAQHTPTSTPLLPSLLLPQTTDAICPSQRQRTLGSLEGPGFRSWICPPLLHPLRAAGIQDSLLGVPVEVQQKQI